MRLALIMAAAFPLGLAAAPSNVQDFIANDPWHHFSDGANGEKIFIKGAQRHDKGRYEVWFKVEHPVPKSCAGNQLMKSPMDRLICENDKEGNVEISTNLYEINCNNGKSRVTESIDYDFSGKVLKHTSNKKSEWSRTIPDTIGEGLSTYFCRHD